MKLSTSWLLPALITVASASLEASVYLLDSDRLPESSNPPTLSPEQARLVFAQRLGASKYHSLEDASATTLSYINKFGVVQGNPFRDGADVSRRTAEVLLIVDGVSSQAAGLLLEGLPTDKLAFYISNSPKPDANLKLADDLSQQIAEGNPRKCSLEEETHPFSYCWDADFAKVIYHDLSKASNTVAKLVVEQKRLAQFAEEQAMNIMVVHIPKSSIASKADKSPYGVYDMPNQANLGRRFVEEPMNGYPVLSPATPNRAPAKASNSTLKPITGVPPVCYSSLDSCTKNTNDCSGHGSCYKKRGGNKACFACGCKPEKQTFLHGPDKRTGVRLVYWGGAACQKKDVSGPFWLISIFSVVMVGLVSWAIGLMYSIGEETLPGVIGAGVSNNKAR